MEAPGPQRRRLAEGRFKSPMIYYGTVSLGGPICLQETLSSITAECLSSLPLSILDSHITRGQDRQQLPWPPAFSVPVYLPPYHLRNGPSVAPSRSLLADHKRHRNSVAK